MKDKCEPNYVVEVNTMDEQVEFVKAYYRVICDHCRDGCKRCEWHHGQLIERTMDAEDMMCLCRRLIEKGIKV